MSIIITSPGLDSRARTALEHMLESVVSARGKVLRTNFSATSRVNASDHEFPRARWKSIRTTNALENLNREFRRRTKTQASFTTEESAIALLFGLVASGQIKLRCIDGYHHLADVSRTRRRRGMI